MITLLSEIHFWSTQEDVIVKPTDYGSFKYFTKKEADGNLHVQAKRQYCEQRNVLYVLNNKRPQKLKDRLKEFEEHLVHNKIVCYNWDDNILRLLLSTGLLVNLTINKSGDLINITFDKQLSAKLQVNIICDGTIFGSQVICICNDGHLLGFGGPWKEGWVLEGGPRRRLNYYGEWLAVWGKAGAEHPQPWAPLAKDRQRANLHLYWIGARDPELLAYKKTDGEPLQVVVSKTHNKSLIVVEQKVTQRGSVSVEISCLELSGNNLKRVSVTSVPLQTQVSCTALSRNEERLAIGCIDGSIALLDRNRGSTRTVKASFIPTFAVWHPEGVVMAVSNERGLLQYYDTALNCVKTQIVGEDCTPTAMIDISSYFNAQFNLASMNWGPKDLVFSLEQGPMATITHIEQSLSLRSLSQRYLHMGKVDKAIKLLLSWDFDEKSFFVLQKIVAYLLRRSLTEDIAAQLQNALASYHCSPIPIPSHIRHKYGGQVLSLTRRFFHQLVRSGMFETAFLLAVDVGHHDLFMDLHYIAVKIGETEMAAAARAQASALLSRCSSEASICSRSSCSQCSGTETSDSEDAKRDSPKPKNDVISPIVLNSDNVLATDFNHPNPTTYKPIKNNVTKTDPLKLVYAPRATFVRSPQVPQDFTNKLGMPQSVPQVPPLPFQSALGIPYTQQKQNCFTNFPNSNTSNTLNRTKNSNSDFFSLNCGLLSSNPRQHSVLFPPLSSQSLNSTRFNLNTKSARPEVSSVNNTFQSFDIMSKSDTIVTSFSTDTPISNNANFIPSHISSLSNTSCNTNASSSKKNSAKVKFSDTVTAFIVPEIKRPVRPQPPPHVTDPQKELADSLPLCHPDDYLKDFTPIKRDEDGEKVEDNSNTQPKIKVVHFGVV